MRIIPVLLLLHLIAGPAHPQAPGESDPTARMRQILSEAAALQDTELQKVPERLAPLLADLHARLLAGTLAGETPRIYREVLLLQLSTQSKLLADEQEIMSTVREILIVDPRIDESAFNPREKQLVNRIRSAETGRLALQTAPPGAEILYLGASLGTTPADLALIAGTYRLQLRKEGFRDEGFEAVIRPSEMLGMERGLRRRSIRLPVAVKAPSVSVEINGKSAGTTQAYETWVASLPADERAQVETAAAAWSPVQRAATYLLAEIPVGEPVKVELRAPCYEPKTLDLTVRDQEVDWSRSLQFRPELGGVELKRDTGSVEILSSPAGGEVLIDGVRQGNTPQRLDVCVGTHRVQVLHPAGQFNRSVLVERGRASQVSGELRPAIAFLGVYSPAAIPGTLAPALPDWETVGRHLAARVASFNDAGVTADEIRAGHKAGTLPIDRLPAAEVSPAELEPLVRRIAADAGHANLLLLGMRNGDRLRFRLYGLLRPVADLIEIPNIESAALDFLARQIDAAAAAPSRLFAPTLGIDLLESTHGIVVAADRRPAAEAKPALPAGSVIRSVDQKPMDYSQLHAYLRTRLAGQSVALEISKGKDPATFVSVPVRLAGAEYPWSTPDGLPNAVAAILNQAIERDHDGRAAGLARLSLARLLMQDKDWKRAAALLERTNLEPLRSGVSPGTVLYYLGRCHEELGDRNRALEQYTRAGAYPEATIGTDDGIPIAELVQRRIQALKKPTQ